MSARIALKGKQIDYVKYLLKLSPSKPYTTPRHLHFKLKNPTQPVNGYERVNHLSF